MNQSERQNLRNKSWRAITVNWDILSTYDNSQGRLYCLTDFQAAWLLSVTEYFRWSSRWENCPCTQSDLDAMKAEMELNLMSCLDFQAWQLQVLYDNQQNGLLAGYDALWDGSNPSSVNPSAPDDYFDGDASSDREDALCTALTLWAYSYAVEWSTKASVLLGIANAVGSLIDFMIPVGGNIAVKVLKDLIAPLQAQVSALTNLDALDTVICDWKDNLEGVAINASNWNNAVSVLAYTFESNEYYIQALFEADTGILANFLSFVNALGNGYDLAQIGVHICACESPPTPFDITVTYDGSGYTDYTVIEGSTDGVNGNPAPCGDSAYNGGINTTRNVTDVVLPEISTVDSVEWQGFVVSGSGIWSFACIMYDDMGGVLYSDLDTGQTQFGQWVNKSLTGLSISGVHTVRFVVGKTGTGVTLRQDNLNVVGSY